MWDWHPKYLDTFKSHIKWWPYIQTRLGAAWMHGKPIIYHSPHEQVCNRVLTRPVIGSPVTLQPVSSPYGNVVRCPILARTLPTWNLTMLQRLLKWHTYLVDLCTMNNVIFNYPKSVGHLWKQNCIYSKSANLQKPINAALQIEKTNLRKRFSSLVTKSMML